jgi:hypothetical protein
MADLGIGIRAESEGESYKTIDYLSKNEPSTTPLGLKKFKAPEAYDLEASKRNTIPLPSLNTRSQSNIDY